MNFNKPMLKEGSLDDQVIVVTGGGSALGQAMTTYFLELGAKVVISSRNIDKSKNTAKELQDNPEATCSCTCHVRI